MPKVALVPCTDYTQANRAVSAAIDLLGGTDILPDPKEKILLKPNLLAKAPPERACTTHPAVFAGVAAYLQENGRTKLSYGDSPGHGNPLQIAKECKIAAEADRLRIPLADFSQGKTVDFPDGNRAKSFVLANGVLDNDCVINLCKMKTHMLERITGAQKNIFGCVFGFNKGASHVAYPNAFDFAEMLADLNRLIRPRLHILDGIDAMEGNGPQSGTPKHMGVILASTDPVALDSLFASLIWLDPYLVPTNKTGEKRGVGVCDPSKITVATPDGQITVKEAREKYGNKSFDVYRGQEDKGEIRQLRMFRKLLRRRPKINARLCVRCGVCVQSCPVKGGALHLIEGKKTPVYDYDKCISCYCCQEMCPKRAIYSYQNPIGKIGNIRFKI